MINKVQKGYRREKIVIDSFKSKGYIYYKPPKTKWGDKDVFNLFDILVYDPKTKELGLISVKSNYGSKEHKKDLVNFCPEKIFISLVEFRGKNKGQEKTLIFNEFKKDRSKIEVAKEFVKSCKKLIKSKKVKI